jgi:hypothetical protein
MNERPWGQAALPSEIEHLARAVRGLPDRDLRCRGREQWLPRYVQDEVDDLNVAALYPRVRRHLDLCATCVAEYLELLDISLAGKRGELTVPTPFSRPDLSFLPPLHGDEEGLA